MLTIDLIKKQFEQFEAHLNGEKEQPLHQVRKKALQYVSERPLPTSKDEEWRFTNPQPMLETSFQTADETAAKNLTLEQIRPFLYRDFEGINLVFVNGYFMPHLSTSLEENGPIRVESLKKALLKNESLLAEVQSREVIEYNTFSALNAAFFSDGLLLEIPENTVLEVPVNILNLSMGNKQNTRNVVRNIVKIGSHSFLRLIETFLSLDDDLHFTNTLTTVSLGKKAGMVHNKIHNENGNAFHVKNILVKQQESSRYVSNNITFGGKLVRTNIKVTLQGQFADAQLNGLYMGHDRQHQDNHTLIEHAVPNCTSHELYQGILTDQASAVFAGKILVARDAQKTDAIQSNNCLLLSDEARIDTMPQLEIYADDVKCTHGATVGQLDEDAVFYLRSRGLAENRAKNLLIYSFAERIIEQIKVESVRDYVDRIILNRFKEDMNFTK